MNFDDAEAVSHNIDENVCTAMSQIFRSSYKNACNLCLDSALYIFSEYVFKDSVSHKNLQENLKIQLTAQ